MDWLYKLISIHKKIGYNLILYYLQAFDKGVWKNNNQPITNNLKYLQEYAHCMYATDYFQWLLGGDLLEKIYVNAETDKNKYFDTITSLTIEPNYLYTCGYQFDEVCHFFTFILTSKLLIIFNTSQDSPGMLSMTLTYADNGIEILKSILIGDMEHYKELFGFALPDNKNTILEPFDATIKKFSLKQLEMEDFIVKMKMIGENLKHDVDKEVFYKIIYPRITEYDIQ